MSLLEWVHECTFDNFVPWDIVDTFKCLDKNVHRGRNYIFDSPQTKALEKRGL